MNLKKNRELILGIPIDPYTFKETLNFIINAATMSKNKQIFIATPNPEMILEAQKNDVFKNILNETSLNIADGIGILWASAYLHFIKDTKSTTFKIIKAVWLLLAIIINPKRIKKSIPERVTGSDLFLEICKNLPKNKSVFLLGAGPGIAEKAALILSINYDTKIAGTFEGDPYSENDKSIRQKINNSGADILFVAFGAPKQEIWIHRNLSGLTNVKIAMGIGGAFDFVSGNISRAPNIMRKLGLEWLYRLFTQPSRFKRIFNASVKFPYYLIKKSL
jgi:N-acetylglucosaminyldiphosphoundecaprenol N-acetyl-beta-D-mannosaminyltransferase